MYKPEYMLAFIVTIAGLAHSWEIAVTVGDKLEFYSKNSKLYTESAQFRDLSALAYDAVNNILLFVDKQSENASIFSFNITTKKYRLIVRRKSIENIQGLAFDPVQGLLFWTETIERSIYWISLKPGSENDTNGNLLIKMDDEIPRAIAVDSCRGYIYWTNTNITKPTIEKARINGTDREVVVDSDLTLPVSLTIDQQTKKIYWADDREGIHYSIGSADLNGMNRETLVVGIYQQPSAITISKDSIFWVDWGFKSIWQVPKNLTNDIEPKDVSFFNDAMPFGIVANYTIEDQTKGILECGVLLNLSQNRLLNIPEDDEMICAPGFTGEKCHMYVCQNYCLRGECVVIYGQPKCRCDLGYSGGRCEVNICYNYCLNNGKCLITEKGDDPICHCLENYTGPRCENKILNDTLITITSVIKIKPIFDSENKVTVSGYLINNFNGEFLEKK